MIRIIVATLILTGRNKDILTIPTVLSKSNRPSDKQSYRKTMTGRWSGSLGSKAALKRKSRRTANIGGDEAREPEKKNGAH
jgi:hypothetical protein